MAPESTSATKATILVVDDEIVIRDLIADVIAEHGYTVLTAGDGQEAVDVFRSHADAIRLIVLDMMMPGMDGRRAFRNLRQISPNVKILIATGFIDDSAVMKLVNEGANGVVNKPFHIDDLLTTIKTTLES